MFKVHQAMSSFQDCWMMAMDSSICCLVMVSGGEKRMMFRWVDLAISPFFTSFFENLSAQSLSMNSMPMKRPFPRIYLMIELLVRVLLSWEMRQSPITAEFSLIFYQSSTSTAVIVTAQASGLPPQVEPCSPGLIWLMMTLSHKTAETGMKPPERALPSSSRSGLTWSCMEHSSFPVLPSPVWISSQISSTLYLSHSSRTLLRQPNLSHRLPQGGTTTPFSPWMGSTMNATMFLLRWSSASRTAVEPQSTSWKLRPLKGPKLRYLSGSSELAQAAMVLPQKFPLANNTVA